MKPGALGNEDAGRRFTKAGAVRLGMDFAFFSWVASSSRRVTSTGFEFGCSDTVCWELYLVLAEGRLRKEMYPAQACFLPWDGFGKLGQIGSSPGLSLRRERLLLRELRPFLNGVPSICATPLVWLVLGARLSLLAKGSGFRKSRASPGGVESLMCAVHGRYQLTFARAAS